LGLRLAVLLAIWSPIVPAAATAQTTPVLPSPLRLGDVVRIAAERRDEIQRTPWPGTASNCSVLGGDAWKTNPTPEPPDARQLGPSVPHPAMHARAPEIIRASRRQTAARSKSIAW
jgi:hypothetical protein